MRITRAAKVAAFPLTALILVALIACQGPAGPAGADGDDGAPGAAGDPGAMGTPGTPGDAGVDALQARDGVAAVLLNPADLVDEDGRDSANTDFGGATEGLSLDLADYFLGGVAPYTYAMGTVTDPADPDILTAEVDEDQLKYTITRDGTTFDAVSYMTAIVVEVTATDSNDVAATADIEILLNQAPTGAGSTTAFTLGTEDGDRDSELDAEDGRHMVCTKINECVLDVFEDNGDFTVSVTGMTQDGKAVSDLIRAEPTDDGNIKLIGLASASEADNVVTVNLKATDEKGLEHTASVDVNVDEAPSVTDLGNAFNGRSYNVDGTLRLTGAIGGWFEDEDTTTLNYTEESENDAIVSSAITGTNLDLTGVALGQTTDITVTATEQGGLGQSASVTFSVTVTGVNGNG